MVGIVSLIDDVNDWAVPLIKQIGEYEPSEIVRLSIAYPGRGGYAANMNELGREFDQTEDEWFLPMNSDVTCEGKYLHILDNLESTILYCGKINYAGMLTWVEGWIYVISREIWETVGEFDENFKGAAFEDADFSWRARDAGFGLETVKLSFEHQKDNPRRRVPGFPEKRTANRNYLIEKWGLPWRPE